MNIIRVILFKILGIKCYLRLVSRTFVKLTSWGFMKDRNPELFYLHTIVKPGFYCLDIGANLGYYSVKLSNIVGEKGKVFSVEPVPMFNEIWKRNIKVSKYNNAELLPYALGEKAQTIQMGTPVISGVLHHGMTKVIEDKTKENYVQFYDVEMKNPDELFLNLERLDFIKIDIEGYESIVFANIINTLKKHRPIIQSELGGDENRKKVIEILREIGYTPKLLINGELVVASEQDIKEKDQDFYFIPTK